MLGQIPYGSLLYNFPKRFRKSRRKARRGRTPRGFTSRVKAIISKQSETKIIDNAVSTNPIAGTSTVDFISGCAIGDTISSREGHVIHITSVEIRLDFRADPNVTVDSHIRVLLVRQNNNSEGVAPFITDVLASDDTNGLPNIANRGDYTVYMDRTMLVPQNDLTANSAVKLINFKQVFNVPKRATYDGDTAAITDSEAGHFYLMFMCDRASPDQGNFSGNVRVSFKDL